MSCTIRLLRESDLIFADQVRALAGWNQTPADWRRLWQYEPSGCFVAENKGELVGTATTTCYGTDLAWIGMLLVHPERQGAGIGTALMSHCLGHLRARGISCIKLDATPQGRPIYERLGFKAEWPLQRWSIERAPTFTASPPQSYEPWNRLEPLVQLDRLAFGADRSRYLESLLRNSLTAIMQDEPREGLAYGFLRPGARAAYLGPIVAQTTPHELVQALLSHVAGQPVYWDIPDHQAGMIEWARSVGFVPQRPLIRMACGPRPVREQPALIFGISGPETG